MKKIASLVLGATFSAIIAFAGPVNFNQVNLVSDIPGLAANTDPNLVNPWGIAFGATSPFWISDNKTGLSTLYNGAGVPQALVVTIPPPGGGASPSAPTGAVFNAIMGDFAGSHFIFATEDGTISAWTSGTSAVLGADSSPAGAVYKGLAIANNGSADQLYAANFNSGHVDVFNSSFAPVSLGGSAFLDPTLPPGYAPFDIQNIGGKLYVTYALQDAAKHDDVAGPGNGFVDVFDANGNMLQRLVSNGALNSPWGMALAPAGFGGLGGDLLIGNFGDGTINVFNATTGTFIETLDDKNGNPIVNQGLWGLAFGNSGPGFNSNTLYFTAGIPGPGGAVEDHGLFGAIAPVPEPGSFALCLAGMAVVGLVVWRKMVSSRSGVR